MKPPSIPRLIDELRRRRVFKGILVYGAATLVIYEGANNLYNTFGYDAAPEWLVYVLAVGFLGSLWFSWIYDITPGGIRKTEPATEKPVPIPKKEVGLYKTSAFLSILVIIGMITYWIVDGKKEKRIASIEKSIAVLPLPDTEEFRKESSRMYYFIGDQIAGCLQKVKKYRVMPWEDSRKYHRTEEATSNEMGQDLSVAILVDWRPYDMMDEKYISVSLISVYDSDLLWSKTFKIEGDWPSEICKHSSKITRRITRELRTHPTLEEKHYIREVPIYPSATMWASLGTASAIGAWERVITGNSTDDSVSSEYIDRASFEKAVSDFTHAIEEDPGYAYAYAERAKAILWGIRCGYFERSSLPACEKDILKAFELEPDLPEAHVAMGFYYFYGLEVPQMAHAQFEQAVKLAPDNIEFLYYNSIIQRTLGRWEEVRILAERIYKVNPRNALLMTNLGTSFAYLHEFHKAIKCQDRAIKLIPAWYAPHINKMDALLSLGQVEEARKALRTANKETNIAFPREMTLLDLFAGDYASAIEHVELTKPIDFEYAGESEADLYLLKAKVYRHAGSPNLARANYKEAVNWLENRIKFNPGDYDSMSKLSVALAGLGRKGEAMVQGEKTLELLKKNQDAIYAPYILYNVIQMYLLAGEYTIASQHAENLISSYSLFTSELLMLDPDFNR